MVVQVFGTKSCNDTKKALRFFKERRVTAQFIDLQVRAAAAGELRPFGQKFGWLELVDRQGKRFQNRRIHLTTRAENQILPMLEADPLLLVTPLIRVDNARAIGWDETYWRAILMAASQQAPAGVALPTRRD